MRKLFINEIVTVVTLLLLIVLMYGCAPARPVVDVSGINPVDESEFATQVNPFVLQHLGALSKDDAAQALLAEVGARLKVDTSGCAFVMANDTTPAAFSLPGCEIVVSRGLMYQLESENELLALLAHLLGHDIARDGLQQALAQRPQQDTDSLTTLSSSYVAAAIASDLISANYSDKQELVADRHAVEILTAAGFDPFLLPEFLQGLYHRLGQLPDSPPGALSQRHPFSANRLKAVEATSKTFSSSAFVRVDTNSELFNEVRTTLLETRQAYDLYLQARQLEKREEVDRAINLYLQAAVSAPDEVLLLTGLGMVYMRQDVLVAARQHLTRAARVDNYYYYPQLGLGYIYLQQKDYTMAAKRLRRSQMLLPTAQGGYLLARVLDEANNIHDALTAYRDVARYFKGSQMGNLAEERIRELESVHELE